MLRVRACACACACVRVCCVSCQLTSRLRAQVIPLTPCAGLLEWVQNTIPLGQYLIGTARDYKSGAHVRYRPNDILSADCRKEMQEAATAKKRRKVSSAHPIV